MSEAEWLCPKCERSNGSWRAACHCCGFRLPQPGLRPLPPSPKQDLPAAALLLQLLTLIVCTVPGIIPIGLVFAYNFSKPGPQPGTSIASVIALACPFLGFAFGLFLCRKIAAYWSTSHLSLQPEVKEGE